MPLNRFIVWIKPYINLIAAALSAWLIAKANVLSIPELGEHGDELTTGIAAAITFGLTTIVTQLGDLKWLKGHHLQLAGDAQVQAAALAPVQPIMGGTMASGPGMDDPALDDPEHDDEEPEIPTTALKGRTAVAQGEHTALGDDA